MDNIELQALYECIHTCKDSKLKKQLLVQLKRERSDFKPPIDATPFLHHVAYGEQDEAEALLQTAPELAQALLKAHNIPFTDHSGRTFTCTAYEYAYWAKDTHMQRMLENYILKNEETRSLILTRVQAIEELVTPQTASGFFEPTRPRGLQYTTQDKEGRTITHCEAHFDLTPLKKALTHYLAEMSKRLSDSEVLKKIWVEEVGRAQRDVPAHIAQEYCHPGRSFTNVVEDKTLLDASNTANLKRSLRVFNWVTPSYKDSWWSCMGGISRVGILRGSIGGAAVLRDAGDHARVDFKALEAIDEVRTGDLRQSLNNLSQPPSVQSSQSHGI